MLHSSHQPPATGPQSPGAIVVMGVSGAGKTVVGRLLAQRLGVPFVDGDDLHSEESTRKLASGEPLTDEDRWPWLDAVGRVVERGNVVVACSALKRTYRNRLRGRRSDLVFVHLDGDVEVLQERVHGRTHAFMPPALLASQLATLEPLEDDEAGLVVDVAPPPEHLVDRIVDWLAGLASLEGGG